jgi:hypothetical protein
MQKKWEYKDYEVSGGLKPGSDKFRYFFVVSQGSEKKCRYCVWIDDDALSQFDPSGDFDAIISSHEQDWNQWVKENLDKEDFNNLVRKFDKSGEQLFNLEDTDEKLTMD